MRWHLRIDASETDGQTDCQTETTTSLTRDFRDYWEGTRKEKTYFSPNILLLTKIKRLLWSRGSVLDVSTQVRGFKPGRRRRIFKGEKILITPSFGGEVKLSVPCLKFTACKRTLKCNVEVGISRQNYRSSFSTTKSSIFRCLEFSCRVRRGETSGGKGVKG